MENVGTEMMSKELESLLQEHSGPVLNGAIIIKNAIGFQEDIKVYIGRIKVDVDGCIELNADEVENSCAIRILEAKVNSISPLVLRVIIYGHLLTRSFGITELSILYNNDSTCTLILKGTGN
jgi:hypothetical protein